MIIKHHRGVAQPGSAPGLGPGGREFESLRPDHLNIDYHFIIFYNFYMRLFIFIPLILIITGCSSPIGVELSPAWFQTQSQASRQAFWDRKKTHELCIYWQDTGSRKVKLDIANALDRRGQDPRYCDKYWEYRGEKLEPKTTDDWRDAYPELFN